MRRILLGALALTAFLFGRAEEEPKAVEPAAAGVRITFLPPPMEGTITLGVFDRKEKLVRVLKQEATEQDFTIGLNGLITQWDGRDDAGNTVPAGRYSIRGFAVGALEIEGVAFHGNDWVQDDDSPRVRRILPGGELLDSEKLRVPAELIDGTKVALELSWKEGEREAKVRALPGNSVRPRAAVSNLPDGAEHVIGNKEDLIAFGAGKVWRKAGGSWTPLVLPELTRVVSACLGENSVWVVDQLEKTSEVKEYAFSGELLRVLPSADESMRAIWIDSVGRNEIALLEENGHAQRLRVLARTGGTSEEGTPAEKTPPTSFWKIVFQKEIHASESFQQAAKEIGAAERISPEAQVAVRLLPNPLAKNAIGNLTLDAGVDKEGAILRSSDGLPLVRLSDAKGLRWAAVRREAGSKAVRLFQSDGAVVEEFRIRKLANIMAFDAGEYDWPAK